MPPSDFRSSPLLSTLGIVALAGVVTPLACREDDGPPPIEDVADVVEVYQDLYAFYCECYGELYDYEEGGADECLAESEIVGEGEQACLQEVFDAHPEAFEVARCGAEALREYLGCIRAKGCPTPFTCDDGTMVLEDYVCDGFADCEDGSDEEQDCPPAPTCSDGQLLQSYSVCDGFDDCADGSDEQDCPDPFVCGDGSEIPAAGVCNGFGECEDGSDEQQNCPETCDSRYEAKEDACGEVSDEVNELTNNCFPYVCSDGTEIQSSQSCDGVEDCPDGEDESACSPPPPGEG